MAFLQTQKNTRSVHVAILDSSAIRKAQIIAFIKQVRGRCVQVAVRVIPCTIHAIPTSPPSTFNVALHDSCTELHHHQVPMPLESSPAALRSPNGLAAFVSVCRSLTVSVTLGSAGTHIAGLQSAFANPFKEKIENLRYITGDQGNVLAK